MGWGTIYTYDIARIHDLASAARHWDSQKPWKNQHASWRQLENRRAFHKHIVKLSDDQGYQMVLYSTPLVTYCTDGSFELQTWDSVSSVDFAQCVGPRDFNARSWQGRMYWEIPTPDGKKFVRPADHSLTIKPLGNRLYEIEGKVVEDFEWKLDLKKAATVRKKLSHYDRWQKLTSRLTGRVGRHHFVNNHALKQLLEDPLNPRLYGTLSGVPVPYTEFLRDAYEIEGARYKVPVPMGELPRRQR